MPSIELPQVKNLRNGQTITADEARDVSTQPDIITYEYRGYEFAMLVDPMKIDSDAERELQRVQQQLLTIRSAIRRVANLGTLPANATEEQRIAYNNASQAAVLEMSDEEQARFFALQRETDDLSKKMLVPCVIECNDPEHFPTYESLTKGTKLGDAQWEALSKWGFSTSNLSEAEKSATQGATSAPTASTPAPSPGDTPTESTAAKETTPSAKAPKSPGGTANSA